MTSETFTGDAPAADKPISVLRSRLMGAMVLLVIIGPMVAAYITYTTGFGISTSTINKGDLLPQAQSISELKFSDINNDPVDLLSGKKKWRVLIPATEVCSGDCQQNLYTSRQVHIRLGEKARRVERIYVMPDKNIDSEFQSYLEREHPRLRTVVVDQQAFTKLLSSDVEAGRSINDRYYLMDQEGFIMMSYGVEHSGNDFLTDLKRMLKYSYADR